MSTNKSTLFGFLSPVERFSEILFGLIMTLSITGTISVITGGREEVGAILLSVVGCNVAWGIIDAVLYLLGTISERGHGYALYEKLKRTGSAEESRGIIAEALPPAVAEALVTDDFDIVRRRLLDLPSPSRRRVIKPEDLGGALGVFLLVVLSCVPLILPFFFIVEPLPALRVSNAVAILMLFIGGYQFARYSGLRKFLTGLVMVALGGLMVGLTVLLGG